VKEVCTTGPARRITRDGRERLVEVMREKLRSEEGREIYKKRLYTVEPVMGDLKWNRMKPVLSLRGLEKVRGEFSLMCLVHNVKKITKRVLEGSLCYFSWRKAPEVAQSGNGSQETILVEMQA
jgi:hypothetical protein